MTERIHNVLNAMDNIATAPFSLLSRLTEPALPPHPSQSPADLTPPPPHPRKRTLTLPLPPNHHHHHTPPPKQKWFAKPPPPPQRTHAQRQSPLLRLPAELRLLIWSHVVLLGREGGEIAVRWRGTGGGRGRASAFAGFGQGAGMGVLGMLRACRVM